MKRFVCLSMMLMLALVAGTVGHADGRQFTPAEAWLAANSEDAGYDDVMAGYAQMLGDAFCLREAAEAKVWRGRG